MTEFTCLELSIVLWLAHITVQFFPAMSQWGLNYLVTPRDEPQPEGLMLGRATRTLANYVENLGPFVAADLGLIVTNHTGGIGATIWIAMRVIYIPLYMSGVKYVRTLCWIASVVGLVLMLRRLAGY